MTNRRCRIVRVSVDLLTTLCNFAGVRTGDTVTYTTLDLPPGVVTEAVEYNFYCNSLVFRLSHPTWDEVPEGEMAPYHPVTRTTHTVRVTDDTAEPKPQFRGREFI